MQSVPEVQTEETVRAFSGTLRRILGVVDGASVDPFTASTTDVAATLVDEVVLIDPYENPWTQSSFLFPGSDRASNDIRTTESTDNLIFAINMKDC